MHPLAHVPHATLGRRLTHSEYAEQQAWVKANPGEVPAVGTPVNGLYFVRFAKLRPGGVLLVTEEAIGFHKARALKRLRRLKERKKLAKLRYHASRPPPKPTQADLNRAFLDRVRAEAAAKRVAICNNPPGTEAKPQNSPAGGLKNF